MSEQKLIRTEEEVLQHKKKISRCVVKLPYGLTVFVQRNFRSLYGSPDVELDSQPRGLIRTPTALASPVSGIRLESRILTVDYSQVVDGLSRLQGSKGEQEVTDDEALCFDTEGSLNSPRHRKLLQLLEGFPLRKPARNAQPPVLYWV